LDSLFGIEGTSVKHNLIYCAGHAGGTKAANPLPARAFMSSRGIFYAKPEELGSYIKSQISLDR